MSPLIFYQIQPIHTDPTFALKEQQHNDIADNTVTLGNSTPLSLRVTNELSRPVATCSASI